MRFEGFVSVLGYVNFLTNFPARDKSPENGSKLMNKTQKKKIGGDTWHYHHAKP
jgi:hypothetical protein